MRLRRGQGSLEKKNKLVQVVSFVVMGILLNNLFLLPNFHCWNICKIMYECNIIMTCMSSPVC